MRPPSTIARHLRDDRHVMKRCGSYIGDRVTIIVLLVAVVLATRSSAPAVGGERVCDVDADSMLDLERYPEAISLHQHLLVSHPNNALAHHHLGFAYGMIGHEKEEMHEYLAAKSLGLKDWDLLLNIGLAYLEQGDIDTSIEALKERVKQGPGPTFHRESPDCGALARSPVCGSNRCI
jgi:tetratricopeptide (TPR) repeat protein